MFSRLLIKVIIGVMSLIVLILILSGFNFSLRPHSKPFTAIQIDRNCPYFKDMFGRVYYSVAYVPSKLFIIGSNERQVQYDYHKAKGISIFGFKIAKILPETKTNTNDPSQLSCIGSYNDSLVYKGFLFKNADLESFEILEQNYFKDKNTVYYVEGKVIPGADSQSFEVLSSKKCPYLKEINNPVAAWDKERVYFHDRLSDLDRKDLEAKCLLSIQSLQE